MRIFMVVISLLMALLVGNKIGFEAAKAKYAPNHLPFGCTVEQTAPNGECQ